MKDFYQFFQTELIAQNAFTMNLKSCVAKLLYQCINSYLIQVFYFLLIGKYQIAFTPVCAVKLVVYNYIFIVHILSFKYNDSLSEEIFLHRLHNNDIYR